MNKILLLDGNSLLFRSFFAIPDEMATADGRSTNAVYGFASMLVSLLRDHSPDGMAVAFDLPQPTFRHELVADYKAGRADTPDTLIPQFEYVKMLLGAMGVEVIEVPGFEADDVVATLCKRAADRKCAAIVVSGDRDTFQLVEDPFVKVLYNKRGVSDYELYDQAGIVARTGVAPEQYVLYAALRGDPSDNLPGVHGVGEKTAAKLVNEYGSVEGIYEHLGNLTPKLRENLAEAHSQVLSNLQMMPLVTDLRIDLGPDDQRLELGRFDPKTIESVCDYLEFKGLKTRLLTALKPYSGSRIMPKPGPTADTELVVRSGNVSNPAALKQHGIPSFASIQDAFRDVDSAAEAVKLVSNFASKAVRIGIDASWSGDRGRSGIDLVAICVMCDQSEVAISFCIKGEWLKDSKLRNALGAMFAANGGGNAALPKVVVADRIKELLRSLIPLGVSIAVPTLDTAVAAYLLDPNQGDYSLEGLVEHYLGSSYIGLLGSAQQIGTLGLDAESEGADAGKDDSVFKALANRAAASLIVEPFLRSALAEAGMLVLYDEIEVPLIGVLAEMEVAGIGVDLDRLEELNRNLAEQASMLDREIQDCAGIEFRVNSTQQLRDVLYTKLGLTPLKKTKTGYSTDAASLERLRGAHPVVEKVLRYREVEKLRSTYGVGLLAEVDRSDSRIHATFNQTVARTGRLSSDRPNLHNIPVRTEDGRRFREAFVAAAGSLLLVADYNQIELRILAHLSGDRGLLEAFASRSDVHTTTAARIFGVEPARVTSAQRAKAKMVSYGLAYGMEAFGLATRLGIAVDEAAGILNAFFANFPDVKAYMEDTISQARTDGYTVTEFGRRRPIPELRSPNFRIRQQGERQAMNAGIQGLAADLFKMALVSLSRSLHETGVKARIVLQVHDEIIVEAPPGEQSSVEEFTRRAMEGTHQLQVPLEVEMAWGTTWAEAKH